MFKTQSSAAEVILTVFGIHRSQFWNTIKRRGTAVNSVHYSEGSGVCVTCHSKKKLLFCGIPKLLTRLTKRIEKEGDCEKMSLL
jgi:hypothetical protein